VALAADGTVDGATVSLVDVVASCAGVIQAVDHVSLIDVRKTLFLQNLDVQVVRAF